MPPPRERMATILAAIGIMLIFLLWGMRIPHTFFRQWKRDPGDYRISDRQELGDYSVMQSDFRSTL
ncbi:hypothetical protein [Cynomolgus macaque cytomegalovirus strain Mauritius]|uniref:Uncharacterized protein n=1 Tax=Cynomolgus macaque cytomegalovirus strain Mauritius TaxID=1690255 RepID=A0A0K1H0E2_9BETA|nr:hypothetical protein [Cynomolgus macaque cytomegalovirus strain Mauritius]AXG21722.1 hypothetical protein [synthetic construct]AXG21990.1 hypothetical protein [synthetic construct]